jgi:sigma-54 dependent transcriptional regulator, acetoin dehydrogenase operon transcriptional activator AcoR
MHRPAHTLSLDSDRSIEANSVSPFLFLALACDRPCADPWRQPLDTVSEIEFGRTTGSTIEQTRSADGARLFLRLPDPTISSIHAHLRRAGGGWELSDASSKNGVFINGERTESRLVADGDLLEMGRTLFLFRRALPLSHTRSRREPDLSIRGMATLSPALEAEFDRVRAIATGSINVSIIGQSGTGKELLASAIHHLSGRTGSFVAFNCGAVPPNLMASELFGFRKGAFSGAEEDRPGLIRSAERGTLFLDEVGDLAPESQVALLRVLQEHEVLPLGATRPVKVDVRFLSATSDDLSARVAAGRFRPDLHARLAGFTCRLPPLAERREDVGLIVAELLRRHAADRASEITISVDAARALFQHRWPGNVRELDNALAAALLLGKDGRIVLSHLPAQIQSAAGRSASPASDVREKPLTEAQAQRRDRIVSLLEAHEGNVSAVARELGKDRVQVLRWLRRFDIDPRIYRR